MNESVLPQLNHQMLKGIDLHLEALYESKTTIQAGQKIAAAGLEKSQISKLENLVLSTRRFSEIINFIKNQTGKDKNRQWTQIADELLQQLEELEGKAKEIGGDDEFTILEVKRHLARGWVKQIAAHYRFAKTKQEKTNHGIGVA